MLSCVLNVLCSSDCACTAAEWAAGAKERELEKIALQHIKAETKAAERAARAEVHTLTHLRWHEC